MLKVNCLVTGCAGFVGYHLCLALLKKNNYVVGIDNLNNYYDVRIKKKRLNILKRHKNFLFLKKDLKNKKSLEQINSKNIKTVYHLAGQAGVFHSVENPVQYIEDNIVSFINLLEFFKKKQKKPSILFASSSSVYGNLINSNVNSAIYPKSIYAVSKFTMEMISRIYCSMYEFKISALRFFTVYGNYGRPDMSYYKFTENIFLRKKITLYNNGNNSRSFTHISDLVNNIFLVSDYILKKKGGYFDIFNIGNPKSYKIIKLIKIIEKNLKKTSKIRNKPLESWDIVKTKSNVSREMKLLKFKFKMSLEEGIKEYVSWFFSCKK